MRIRVRYSKLGKIRFISAIDMGRIWERSLRLAALPIAYSEGFSPHPKISFPDALTLGYASTGEYAELTFEGDFALPPAIAELNRALPDGLDVLQARPVPEGAPRLSKWLECSLWDLAYDSRPDLRATVSAVMGLTSVAVMRERKDECIEVDVRPAIVHLCATDTGVRVVLEHTEPPMRPQEVHRALTKVANTSDGSTIHVPPLTLVTRIAQGQPTNDGICEALNGDSIPVQPARQKVTIE